MADPLEAEGGEQPFGGGGAVGDDGTGHDHTRQADRLTGLLQYHGVFPLDAGEVLVDRGPRLVRALALVGDGVAVAVVRA